MEQIPSSRPGTAAGEGCREAAADLGFLEPPSPLLAAARQNCRSTAALRSAPTLWGTARGFPAPPAWPRNGPFGDVGRASQNPAPGALPCWQPGSASARPQPQPRSEFSPVIPERLERGEGRWSPAGEGGLKEERNNQKHGERDEMLQKSWPEGNKGAKNNPPKAAMGARGNVPTARRNGVTLQLPPRCSC